MFSEHRHTFLCFWKIEFWHKRHPIFKCPCSSYCNMPLEFKMHTTVCTDLLTCDMYDKVTQTTVARHSLARSSLCNFQLFSLHSIARLLTSMVIIWYFVSTCSSYDVSIHSGRSWGWGGGGRQSSLAHFSSREGGTPPLLCSIIITESIDWTLWAVRFLHASNS